MKATDRISNRWCGVVVGALLGMLVNGPADGQVLQLINYQGRVVVGSTNFNGSGQFKFALVNTDGSTTYWSNDGTSTAGSQPTAAVTLTVSQGLYSLLLGDATQTNMTAIPVSVFGNSDVRLRVWFNDGTHGFQLLTPDQRIAAVGYAMMAGNVPNGAITSAQIANGAVGSSQLAPSLTLSGSLTAGSFLGDGSGLSNLSLNSITGSGVGTITALGKAVNGAGGLAAFSTYGALATPGYNGTVVTGDPAIYDHGAIMVQDANSVGSRIDSITLSGGTLGANQETISYGSPTNSVGAGAPLFVNVLQTTNPIRDASAMTCTYFQTPAGSTYIYPTDFESRMFTSGSGSNTSNQTAFAGIRSVITNQGTGQNVTTLNAFTAHMGNQDSSGGVVALCSAYTLDSVDSSTAAPITEFDGLNIPSILQTGIGTAYAIRQRGISDLNSFAGASTFNKAVTINGISNNTLTVNETQTNGGTVASFNAPNMTTGNNCEDWLGVGFGTAQAYENTFYYVGANSTANYAELGLLSEPGMAIFGTGDVSIRNTTDSAPLSVTGNAIISGTVTQSATSTMLKANGSGTLVAATAGTDYQGVIAKVTGTLSSGTATISNGAITASSAISACHLATSAANAGALYVSALSPGSVTIKSTNPSDNDTFVITIQ